MTQTGPRHGYAIAEVEIFRFYAAAYDFVPGTRFLFLRTTGGIVHGSGRHRRSAFVASIGHFHQ